MSSSCLDASYEHARACSTQSPKRILPLSYFILQLERGYKYIYFKSKHTHTHIYLYIYGLKCRCIILPHPTSQILTHKNTHLDVKPFISFINFRPWPSCVTTHFKRLTELPSLHSILYIQNNNTFCSFNC